MDSSLREFWQEKLSLKDDPNIAIVDHRFYVIGSATDKVKGFYGKKFRILFHDGRIVESDNLWNGAEVPEECRSQLPNNATFLPL